MKTKTVKPVFKFGIVILLCFLAKLSNAQVSNNAYGDNMVQVDIINGQPVFAIYSGDINQDGGVDILDFALEETDVNNFAFGYNVTDLNGDGSSDILDYAIIERNANAFVFKATPNP